MIENLPKLIAHRGASIWAPENTLSALQLAHAMGATWVEFDVRLTQDGVPVIFHDEKLERTSNGKGLLSEHTYEQIELLNVGSWFGDDYEEERIPTLAHWLQACAELKMGINLELKGRSNEVQAIANAVHEALRQHWSVELPAPLVSSTSLNCLQAMRDLDANIALGLISDLWRDDWRQVLQSVGCVSWHVEQHDLGPEQVAAVTNAGYAALAFTVNDLERAEKLIQWGVSAVFSDNPHLFN